MIDNKCISAHNNFIKGADSKIYREKEMLFFYVDIDKYYSESDANYFTFIYFKSTKIYDIEKIIWIGLTFSNSSKYIFILPRILCKYCNVNNKYWCSFVDCWKVRNLNNCFEKKYRENV